MESNRPAPPWDGRDAINGGGQSRLNGLNIARPELGSRQGTPGRSGRIFTVLAVVGLACFLTPLQAQIRSGFYTGDGTDDRQITGVGFQPDLVFVKRIDMEEMYARSSTMPVGDSKQLVGNGGEQNRIKSFVSDGFVLGTDPDVNENGKIYHWVAFRAVSGEMEVGTYSGNGQSSHKVAGLGFQPDYVIVMSEAGEKAVHRTSAQSGDMSVEFESNAEFPDRITSLSSPVNGFTVGTNDQVNKLRQTYHYAAWTCLSGKFSVGSYLGDNTDNRIIDDSTSADGCSLDFVPEWVVIKSADEQEAVHHPASLGLATDETLTSRSSPSFSDGIQSLDPSACSNCFEIGTDNTVNENGRTLYWAAFGGATQNPLPVTLASFQASRAGQGTSFEWTTASELGNVGFNLYALQNAAWKKLNSLPIPSHAVDSSEPQFYRFQSFSSEGQRFRLEDIDIHGHSTFHGPFSIGERAGVVPSPAPIDWKSSLQVAHSSLAPVPRVRKALVVRPRDGWGRRPRSFSETYLLVDRDGLYRVTYEDLQAAGIEWRGAPARDVALLRMGSAVPIRVGGPLLFGPGSFIDFVGVSAGTLYTDTMPYELLLDSSQALRMEVDSRAPDEESLPNSSYRESQVVERNREYSISSPIGDPWYDERMLVFTDPGEWTYDLDVEDLSAGAAATLSVSFWGVTDWPAAPDHHVQVEFNGQLLGDEIFDGRLARNLSFQIPEGLLREGTNQLALRLPADTGVAYDLVNLENYSLEFPRRFQARDDQLVFTESGSVFQIGNFSTSQLVAYRVNEQGTAWLSNPEILETGGNWSIRLAGDSQPAQYRVVSVGRLLRPEIAEVPPPQNIREGSADYLIISHPDFLEGLAPLVSAREAEGLRAKVVDVRQIYQQFSYGLTDPQAIKQYIAEEASQQGTRFILLVGGDTYDYKNYLGLNSVSFIPSLYAATGGVVEHAPVDALYADLDGDLIQDLAIGRFPVRNRAELERVIEKTLTYSTATGYSRRALFAADAEDREKGISFSRTSDELAGVLGSGWDITRAYLDEKSVGEAREVIQHAIEEGVSLTYFLGHSGPSVWTFSGLFSSDDVAFLNNFGRPTLVTQWGCWNNYHVEPTYDTLGQTLLLSAEGGAAAVLGASTLTLIESDQALGRELIPLLVEPGLTIGEATLRAKQNLAKTSSNLLDVLLGWTLLGDPAIRVQPLEEGDDYGSNADPPTG